MSASTIKLKCRKCRAQYFVDPAMGGKRTQCPKCGAILFGPFPNSQALFDWAATAPWNRLAEYVSGGYAAGWGQDVIDRFVQIWTNRRWGEEEKTRSAMVESRVLRNEFARIMERWKPGAHSDQLLETAFENLIISVFSSLGYSRAKAYKFGEGYYCAEVSAKDKRVEVVIFPASPNADKLGATDIRAIRLQMDKLRGGRGHVFSTAGFTAEARTEAKKHRNLKTYNSVELAWLVDTADNNRNKSPSKPYSFD